MPPPSSPLTVELHFELLKRLRALEPLNPEWLDWQAEVYALAVRSSFADGIPRVRGMLAQPAHFPFTLPVVDRRLLKSELESSSDAALVGRTPDELLKEIAPLQIAGPLFQADAEIQASEAFAKPLQAGLQQLKSR